MEQSRNVDLVTWFVLEGIALARELEDNPSPRARAQIEGRIEAHVRAARRVCGVPVGAEVLNAIRASAPDLPVLA